MPLAIEHFPDNPEDRKYCFVWTRAKDGARIRFGCSTQEDCEHNFDHYNGRAVKADDHNSETM